MLAAPLLVSASPPAQQLRVRVEVQVTGLRSDKGIVRACMTSLAGHFPDCSDDSGAYSASVASGEPLTIVFPAVVPGEYAIAVLHDENGNGKADRLLGTLPREGFGFSRDARLRMGPPRFSDAAFEVGSRSVHQAIRMRYIF
ncbi:conserved hypothetical protein [Altererythrobacter sp. B11]|nr:conserved hypothetical protein [Altererythrobacter sp. B11]